MDEKVDMLVMPESFIPFRVLPQIISICQKNQLAVVAGIEHIKINNFIYNITAIVLPCINKYKEVHVFYHLKKHYSPEEKMLIEGHRLCPVKGKHYELYNWNDCWFPIYCCFELASIADRALFQSYSDVLVAVEWNKDVNYYKHIIGSLSRDLHCYCIQVNSSNYGDSRITQPSKTELMNIICAKGGTNPTILIDDISINDLREFQFKEYELQQRSQRFKYTPPQFDKHILELKMQQKLWEVLKSKSR